MPNNKHHVQMTHDNYDVLHNPIVREKYPTLYQEVAEHDKVSTSSWYDFTDKAYAEYNRYIEDMDIEYVT